MSVIRILNQTTSLFKYANFFIWPPKWFLLRKYFGNEIADKERVGKMRVLLFYVFCYGIMNHRHQHHANDAIIVILLFGSANYSNFGIYSVTEFIHNEFIYSVPHLVSTSFTSRKHEVFLNFKNLAQTRNSQLNRSK